MSKALTGFNPAHPEYFTRSNMVVTDREVIIGDNHFPLPTVLRAEVITIYAPLKTAKDVMRGWLFATFLPFVLIAIGYNFLVAATLGYFRWPFGVGLALASMFVLGIELWKHLVRKQPGTLEHRLMLYTTEGSAEWIQGTRFDKKYLELIAAEINRRVRGQDGIERATV